MRFKTRSLTRPLIKAMAEDAAPHVLTLASSQFAFSGFFKALPVATLVFAGQQLNRFRQKHSLSAILENPLVDWERYYSRQLLNCIQLKHGRKTYLLPYVPIRGSMGITSQNVIFQYHDRTFSLDPAVRSLTEPLAERVLEFLKSSGRYYAANNLRPEAVSIVDGKLYMDCGQVNYEQFVRSNLLLDANVPGKAETLRNFVHPEGKLSDVGRSKLADHLGIEMLVLTSDGTMVFQVRSRKVAYWKNQLCGGASGAIVPEDLRGFKSISLAKILNLRELGEEIGLQSGDIDANSIKLLGIVRNLLRGGKPELLLCATTLRTIREIVLSRSTARDRYESKKLKTFSFGEIATRELTDPHDYHEFLLKMDQLLRKYGHKMTFDLLAAIAMWTDHRLGRIMPSR